MPTPKRLLLMLGGFLFFFAAFLVYYQLLGSYDGLPPLPEAYRPGAVAVPAAGDGRPVTPNSAIARIREAFGSTCEEQDRRIKSEWKLQGIVLAADDWKLLDDGRLQLLKVSVAVFGKPDSVGKYDINTIRGDSATIEFDQPIKSLRDTKDRKPIGGRLEGKTVELRNNRGTATPDDDLRLYTEWLAFRDDQHRVWTEGAIRLVDSDPPQATVTATGMEVILIPGEQQKTSLSNRAAPSKGRATIKGVKYVRLERDVCMLKSIDARQAFLGNGGPSEPEDLETAATRTPLAVTSRGVFTYYPGEERDRAEFQDGVSVIRTVERTGAGKAGAHKFFDQLDCDRLELEFARRSREGRRPTSEKDGLDRSELVRAHATGKQVELVSDSARLHATGSELVYDQIGDTTTLHGSPEVLAEKDRHQLRLQGKLVLRNPPRGSKEIQDILAQGPGQIRLHGEPGQPQRGARWSEELRFHRDGELDRLVLLGQASFEDPASGRRLQAEELMVWLDPSRQGAPSRAPAKEANEEQAQRQVRRLEATTRVSLTSRELVIPRADRLLLLIEDGVIPEEQGPQPRAGAASARPLTAPPQTSGDKPRAASPLYDSSRPEGAAARAPIELSARSVDAKVLRDGNRTELKRVWTEGEVRVMQRPTEAGGQSVEIRAHTLELLHALEGDLLTVAGRGDEPAFVQMDRLSLLGPVVKVDQAANTVEVVGLGSMKMPNKNDFQGNPLEEPADLIVHWNRLMTFDGKMAEFDGVETGGGVVAIQGTARLACRKLEVELDRHVSLKGQGRDEPPAGLHRLLCDQDIRLEDGIREGEQWKRFQRIVGCELLFDRSLYELRVNGPDGEVRILQADGQTVNPLAERTPPKRLEAGNPGEPRLTWIIFQGRMQANRVTDKASKVRFVDGIELVHLAAADPDLVLSRDRLPPGSLYLRSDELEVLNQKLDEHRSSQDFQAKGNVTVRSEPGPQGGARFHARADVVKYEEAKDQLIMEAAPSNYVLLYRQKTPGARPEPMRAKRFIYNRRDGSITADRTDAIQTSP